MRRLATAEVGKSPGGIPQHAQLPAVAEELEEGTQGTLLEDKVPARRAVTSDVAKRPNSLLSDIWLMAAEKFDEDGDGAGLDDNLCLLSGTGGDVGQSPSRFKLNQGVWGSKELDEAADNASLDDTLDGRVPLF